MNAKILKKMVLFAALWGTIPAHSSIRELPFGNGLQISTFVGVNYFEMSWERDQDTFGAEGMTDELETGRDGIYLEADKRDRNMRMEKQNQARTDDESGFGGMVSELRLKNHPGKLNSLVKRSRLVL